MSGVIPIASCEHIIKNAGANRVSKGAAKSLREVLEGYGETISKKAISLSTHAGRVTVKDEDIKLASKN